MCHHPTTSTICLTAAYNRVCIGAFLVQCGKKNSHMRRVTAKPWWPPAIWPGTCDAPPLRDGRGSAIQFISSSHLFRVMHQCIHKALSPKRPHDSTTLKCLASSLTDSNILRGSSLRFRMRCRLDEPLLPAACIGFAGSASDCGNSSGPTRCTATVPVPAAPLKAAKVGR